MLQHSIKFKGVLLFSSYVRRPVRLKFSRAYDIPCGFMENGLSRASNPICANETSQMFCFFRKMAKSPWSEIAIYTVLKNL